MLFLTLTTPVNRELIFMSIRFNCGQNGLFLVALKTEMHLTEVQLSSEFLNRPIFCNTPAPLNSSRRKYIGLNCETWLNFPPAVEICIWVNII
ncbi:hypothetical protein VN97_g3563 [Penicillium thymicola]|uniref:Uncharacterized protein n=1 Tax=Penicillium thymicola TaxID=293382 RepID=A0AAI9TM16_PENTH|nr:hypothetical protein VN97_g3563 [Penicillium thymicola]